jgi:hypothetical protein
MVGKAARRRADIDMGGEQMVSLGRTALAILTGLLWSGALPATMPVTASIFGIALALWVASVIGNGLQSWGESQAAKNLQRLGS